MRYLVIVASLIATPAFAACPAGSDTFLSCTMSQGRKALDVCADATGVRYSFGSTGGTPDLSLAERYADLDYTPWPGIGRTIWETVVFRNAGYAYTVSGSIDRDADQTTPDGAEMAVTAGGQVMVSQGDQTIATLTCDPDTVDFPWTEALSDGKRAAGFSMDSETRTWVPVAN